MLGFKPGKKIRMKSRRENFVEENKKLDFNKLTLYDNLNSFYLFSLYYILIIFNFLLYFLRLNFTGENHFPR